MPTLLPPIGVSAAFLPYAMIAVAMIGLTIFLLGRVLPSDGRPPLVTQMLLALSVLGGGSLLLFALLFVFLEPNGPSAWTWVLLAFNFMMMAPAGLWFVSVVVYRDRRIAAEGWRWPVALGLATTGSEAIMGVLFALVGADRPLPASTALALGLTSAWFFWSMAAVMVALIVWAPLTPIERNGSVALACAAVVAPWVTTYPLVAGLAVAALMATFILGLAVLLLRRAVSAGEVGFLSALVAAFFAMAVGGLAVAVRPTSDLTRIAFGALMGVTMVGEVAFLVHRYYRGSNARPWVSRALDSGPVQTPATLGPSLRPEAVASDRT